MTVYFIQSDSPDQLIKIGVTKGDVFKRLIALRTASPYSLRLLHDIDGDEKTEQEMHVRFIHLHHRGEWFRPGEDLLAFCGVKPKKPQREKRPKVPAPPPYVPPSITEAELFADIEQSILDPSDDYVDGLDRLIATRKENAEHSRYVRRVADKYSLPIPPRLLAYIAQFEPA